MTAKSQLNIRIGPASRRKLDYLTTRYGTQAEVISVAIDRLYQSEMTDPFERELWQATTEEERDIATNREIARIAALPEAEQEAIAKKAVRDMQAFLAARIAEAEGN